MQSPSSLGLARLLNLTSVASLAISGRLIGFVVVRMGQLELRREVFPIRLAKKMRLSKDLAFDMVPGANQTHND